MAEEAIKQRLNRAIKAAARCLDQPRGSYQVTLLNNGPFHIEAIREKEIRKIRVVLEEVTRTDENVVKRVKLPSICSKEIWCKKFRGREFFKRDII